MCKTHKNTIKEPLPIAGDSCMTLLSYLHSFPKASYVFQYLNLKIMVFTLMLYTKCAKNEYQ